MNVSDLSSALCTRLRCERSLVGHTVGAKQSRRYRTLLHPASCDHADVDSGVQDGLHRLEAGDRVFMKLSSREIKWGSGKPTDGLLTAASRYRYLSETEPGLQGRRDLGSSIWRDGSILALSFCDFVKVVVEISMPTSNQNHHARLSLSPVRAWAGF